MATRMMQMTEWESPDAILPTSLGEMPYIEWLHRELERFSQQRGRIAAIRKHGSTVALFVDRVAGEPQPTDVELDREDPDWVTEPAAA